MSPWQVLLVVVGLEDKKVDLVVLIEHRAQLAAANHLSSVLKPIYELRPVAFNVMAIVAKFLLGETIHGKLDVLYTALELRIVVTR